MYMYVYTHRRSNGGCLITVDTISHLSFLCHILLYVSYKVHDALLFLFIPCLLLFV